MLAFALIIYFGLNFSVGGPTQGLIWSYYIISLIWIFKIKNLNKKIFNVCLKLKITLLFAKLASFLRSISVTMLQEMAKSFLFYFVCHLAYLIYVINFHFSLCYLGHNNPCCTECLVLCRDFHRRYKVPQVRQSISLIACLSVCLFDCLLCQALLLVKLVSSFTLIGRSTDQAATGLYHIWEITATGR